MADAFHLEGEILVLESILLLYGHSKSHADSNMSTGTECSREDNSTLETSFQTSLNDLGSLSANVALNNGFYQATVGKSSHKIHGLVRCRADVPASDCTNCTKESVAVALTQCSKSRKVSVWFTRCFLQYWDETFFGVEDTSFSALDYGAGFDDQDVATRGLNFMSMPVSESSMWPLMFVRGKLGVGRSGKRFGMVQCTRDISRSDCTKCLQAQWDNLISSSTFGQKRGWGIHGKSCSM